MSLAMGIRIASLRIHKCTCMHTFVCMYMWKKIQICVCVCLLNRIDQFPNISIYESSGVIKILFFICVGFAFPLILVYFSLLCWTTLPYGNIRHDMLIVETLWNLFLSILYNIKTLYLEYGFSSTAFYDFSYSSSILLFHQQQAKSQDMQNHLIFKSTIQNVFSLRIIFSNTFCSACEMEGILKAFLN